MDLVITGRRYEARLVAEKRSSHRSYSCHAYDRVYEVWWWRAECVIVDRATGKDRVCVLSTREQERSRETMPPLLEDLFGALWSDPRVVDREAFVDAVLADAFVRCAHDDAPIPHVCVTVGPQPYGDTPAVSEGDLVRAGALLDDRGQRSLPLGASL